MVGIVTAMSTESEQLGLKVDHTEAAVRATIEHNPDNAVILSADSAIPAEDAIPGKTLPEKPAQAQNPGSAIRRFVRKLFARIKR